MYLNETYGTLKLEKKSFWIPHFQSWPKDSPICVHAEGDTLAIVLLFSHLYDKTVHICHVSTKEDILLIKEAKKKNMKVTCEVAPHHLFLCDEDLVRLGSKGTVKPALATQADQDALWENLDVVDCFATDHAPHLLSEKQPGNSKPGKQDQWYAAISLSFLPNERSERRTDLPLNFS